MHDCLAPQNTPKQVKPVQLREFLPLYFEIYKFPIQIYTAPQKRTPIHIKESHPPISSHEIPNFVHLFISVITKPTQTRSVRSVLVIGVLLRRPSVLFRVGLLGLSLQGTIFSRVRQPSRIPVGANGAGTVQIDMHVPSSSGGAEAPVAERSGICTSIVS